MKVQVDSERCQGHNRCCTIAPELFDVDSMGMAYVLNAGAVPANLEDKARACADNCPEFAVEIVEE